MRFKILVERDADPTQYLIWDTWEKTSVARYSDKKTAEEICETLNENSE